MSILGTGRTNHQACLRAALIGIAALCLASCAEMTQVLEAGTSRSASNESTLARAIKESLELGSVRASDLLSKAGGYSNHPLYRIELPEQVQPIAKRLRQFGLGGQLDQIETLMNRGAEQAAVEAKAVFVDAVRAMTVTDALGIIRGQETAATDYFRRQTEAALRQRYTPIIQRNLEQIGFYAQYRKTLNAYKQLPIQNKPNLDLEEHVLTQSLNALFAQVAEEEKLIRRDPLGRGSSAIAAVFGK